MWPIIYEALKTAGALILVAFILVAYLLLGACDNEGAGFNNTGRQAKKSCVERDARGNEVWRSC